MTLLSDLMDMVLLDEMIEKKYVRQQSNPSLPIWILNYTEHAQFDRVWNEVTRQCRGLIVDADGEILARPYPKFFNHGEPGAAPLELGTPAYVSDKMDGSLGIMYPTRERDYPVYRIATRGSFTSHQAAYATSLLWEKYPRFAPLDGVTVLFEIIYPDNRIVLDYGDTCDLFLLGGVDIATGTIFAPDLIPLWEGPVAGIMAAKTLKEALALPPRENAEGIVIQSGYNMVKIKQEDYVALHRIITNTSARVIWEHLAVNACKHLIARPKDWATFLHLDPRRAEEVLAVGDDWQDKMLHGVPDEFYGWFRGTIEQLTGKVEDINSETMIAFHDIKAHAGDDRKTFALQAREYTWPGMLFQLLDGRDITTNLWVTAYPAAEKPWGQRSEDVA